jgi:tetratricopeptide (TPR) repeat protein
MYEDCLQDKDLDRKIRGCTQVIERGKQESQKNRSIAYNNRGNAYKKKGHREAAVADFQKALEIDPSDLDAKNSLKRLGAMP